MNTDLAYNAWQNITASFQNQGPQGSPLDAAIGKVPSLAAQDALTAAEVAVAPGNGAKIVARYLAEQLTVNGMRGVAGSANGNSGGGGGGGGGGAGAPVNGGGPSSAFQLPPLFKAYPMGMTVKGVSDSGVSYISPNGTMIQVWASGLTTFESGSGESGTVNANGSVTYAMTNGTTITIGGFAGGTIVWGLESATRWE